MTWPALLRPTGTPLPPPDNLPDLLDRLARDLDATLDSDGADGLLLELIGPGTLDVLVTITPTDTAAGIIGTVRACHIASCGADHDHATDPSIGATLDTDALRAAVEHVTELAAQPAA